MCRAINQKGMSMIEILIYVAILAVIGVVLSNYFVAAMNTQSEHDQRNDLASSAQNITALLRRDVRDATQLLVPISGATSTTLSLLNASGTITYTLSGNTLVRTEGTSTQSVANPSVRISELLFTGNTYTEPRLSATTTSLQYHILLQHMKSTGMLRTVDGMLLIGHDGL